MSTVKIKQHYYSTLQPPHDASGFRAYKDAKRSEFMTEDEMQMVNDMICALNLNQGSMNDLYDRWRKEEDAYKGDQAKKSNRPNSRVNLVNANIEGQVSALVEQNLSISTRGESPSDQGYAEWGRIGVDWTFRKNKMKRVISFHERRRLKFGSAWFKVYFDPEPMYGFGLATITTPSLTKIYIDGKIKDPLLYDKAEYIAEVISMSYSQMLQVYGEDKANSVEYGLRTEYDEHIFLTKDTEDDNTGATIIQWWCKYDGMLRVIEFSSCGVLLYDSHKDGDRQSNQRDMEYNHKPYYTFVDNKYPYFFTTMYPEEGQLYGFGDGKLLRPLQDMINDLYDKIRISARPNLILVDVDSDIDLDDFDDDSFTPQPCKNPTRAVHSVSWGVVNESWWRLLAAIHTEVQRVTRFSDLMIGQGSAAATATEASIQQQQGNAATNQKKGDLEISLQDVAGYCLGLMMEFYTEGKAFRISDKKDDYTWIDFREMSKIPAMKPATSSYSDKYMTEQRKRGGKAKRPKWELLENADGTSTTKCVDLDIEISVGAGLPKNKSFLYQMFIQLAPLVVDGKQLVSWEEMRRMLVDFLGLPLEGEDEMKMKQQMQQIQQQQMMQQQTQTPPQSADTEGVAQGGSPALSMLQGTPREIPQTSAITGK